MRNNKFTIYYQQYQLMNAFQITSQLEDVYPDINGELCSKHTVLLNQIQKAYRKAFPMHPPTHYVISKALLQLVKTNHSTVSMALEQGTIIMYSAGDEGGQLHIAGNFLEDIVLEGSGKALNSQNQAEISLAIRKMVELATEDLSLNKINGGFVYIHCQDSINNIRIQNSLLICLFMAIISLNDLLQEYNQEDLIEKLKASQYLASCDVQAYFSCNNNRQLLLKREEVSKMNLQNKYKLLFLSISFIDEQFYQQNQGNQYEEMIEQMSQSNNILAFFSNIQAQLRMHQYNPIFEQVSKVKEDLKIKTFILCDKYAIFLVETYRYAQLIGRMSRSIHNIHKIKSQAPDNGQLAKRFSSQININSILFSSVPSRALSILDPSECIWY